MLVCFEFPDVFVSSSCSLVCCCCSCSQLLAFSFLFGSVWLELLNVGKNLCVSTETLNRLFIGSSWFIRIQGLELVRLHRSSIKVIMLFCSILKDSVFNIMILSRQLSSELRILMFQILLLVFVAAYLPIVILYCLLLVSHWLCLRIRPSRKVNPALWLVLVLSAEFSSCALRAFKCGSPVPVNPPFVPLISPILYPSPIIPKWYF